jgi:hypothetical protein
MNSAQSGNARPALRCAPCGLQNDVARGPWPAPAIRVLAVFIREFEFVLSKMPFWLDTSRRARSSISALGWSERDLRTTIAPAPSRRNSPAKTERLIVKYNEFTTAGEFRVQRHDVRRERLQTTMNTNAGNDAVGAALVADLCPQSGRPYARAGRSPDSCRTHQAKARRGFPGRAQLVSFNFKNKVICAKASSAGGATVAWMEPTGRREASPDGAIRDRRSRIALRSMRATKCRIASPLRSPARSSPTSPASAPRVRPRGGARR